MMPLNLANIGEETLILKVGGNPEIRKHLADLGFRPRRDGYGRIGDRRESDREGQGIPRCHQR